MAYNSLQLSGDQTGPEETKGDDDWLMVAALTTDALEPSVYFPPGLQAPILLQFDDERETIDSAALWSLFLRCEPLTALEEETERCRSWVERGYALRGLPRIARFAQGTMLNGVSLFGVLVVCNGGDHQWELHWLQERARRPAGDPVASLDKAAFNAFAEQLLSVMDSPSPVCFGEWLDCRWDAYDLQTARVGTVDSIMTGKVMKARMRRNGQWVCIQLMKIRRSGGLPALTVRALRLCHSPPFVRFYASFEHVDAEDGLMLCIVCEWCDTDVLQTIVKQAALMQEPLIWPLFLGMAAALYAAHKRRSFHVSLENFLVNSDVSEQQRVRLTILPICWGETPLRPRTPHAFSSQWARVRGPDVGEHKHGKRRDVWDLGCCLYSMCALRHPFADTPVDEPEQPRYPPLPSHYSQQLRDIAQVCLTERRTERPFMAGVLRMVGEERLKAFDAELAHEIFGRSAADEAAELHYEFVHETGIGDLSNRRGGRKS